jgi:hypothetical protein
MPDQTIKEGFIMPQRPHPGGGRPADRGVWKKGTGGEPDVKTADFSYQNDNIADMIVRAWGDATFRDGLVGDTTIGLPVAQRILNAKTALQSLNPPINLTSPIVLQEVEYDKGWDMDDPNQIVFVLPNKGRQSGDLFESAKLLMACVPNGI